MSQMLFFYLPKDHLGLLVWASSFGTKSKMKNHPNMEAIMSPTNKIGVISPPTLTFREAAPADLPFLHQLEQMSFSENRQSSRESLRRSISSSSQLVVVVENERRKNR